jgi:hypothetical protein
VKILDQCSSVFLLLAKNRFKSVLKEIPSPFVFPVVSACITAVQGAHQLVQGQMAGSDKKVVMVVHQDPCITLVFAFFQPFRKTGKEIEPVIVIDKELFTLDRVRHYVEKGTRRFYTGHSRHIFLRQKGGMDVRWR